MNSDRLRLYIIEFSLILVLLLALIFNEYITRTIIMTVLLVFMVIAIKFIKGQKTETIYKKQMILLVSTIAIIYVAILYMLGIKLGFYSSVVKFSKWSIINYIIPYVVIIISSEIIRKQILIKQQKKANLIILIAMILLEIIISTNISSIKTLKDYGYWIVGTDMEGTEYTDIDYKTKIALVIGNEGKGMSHLVGENCDYIAKIPMKGTVNSLNASVACGIFLSEITRSRG